MAKACFIGYMLGQEIISTNIDIEGESQPVYAYANNNNNCPTIGHFGGMTKGGRAYKRYIDTAGLFDPSGDETDICNAAAIHMVTQTCSPRRLIIMVPSSIFFDGRGQGLMHQVTRLQKILYNATDKSVLSSILFLVNEKSTTKIPIYKFVLPRISFFEKLK